MNLRDELGKMVREEWIEWAKTQPNPKPSWLVPWENLGEADKEVDRAIGVTLWRKGMADACDIIAKHQYAWSGALNRLIAEAFKGKP